MARKTGSLIAIILVVVVALGLCSFAAQKSYIVTIRPANLTMKTSGTAPIQIVIQNVSSRPLEASGLADPKKWVTIMDDKGQSVPPKDTGEVTEKYFPIGANETRVVAFDLAQIFSLAIGTYMIKPTPHVAIGYGSIPSAIKGLFWLRDDESPATVTVTAP